MKSITVITFVSPNFRLREFGGRSLESLRGAIIKLKRFFFNPYFETPNDTISFIVPLVIEEFGYVGGEGSPVHGDPRYLMAVPLMRQIAERITQTEASKSLESSFSIATIGGYSNNVLVW